MHKTCTQCSAGFTITDEDLAFYDAVSPVIAGTKYLIPPPTLCPDCRYQNRLTWRNERNLYRNICKATGKAVVSIFSPEKTWPPVYEQKYWWSDAWDAKSYGRDMDFTRPFFEQWAELFQVVPQLAMNNQASENCEYTNQSEKNKDCYMMFCSNDSRDCLHGMWVAHGLNCVDCLYVERGELCYEAMNCSHSYHCAFSQNLENCSDVFFSRNCIGCKHCFGCVNLRNKEYFFFNEQLSKEEYEERIREMPLSSHATIQHSLKLFSEFSKDFPRKYYSGANNEDATGDYLLHDHDVHHSFNCRNSEHLCNCQDAWWGRNCRDLTETAENDFSYSLEGAGQSSNALFSKKFIDSSNILYCSHCNFSKNLFGCVGLNHAQFCILNKQYTKDEYEELVPKIIEHMKQTPLRSLNGSFAGHEWGSHFPSELSPYGYNETVAQEYFPLTREEALAKGYGWREAKDETPQVERILPASQLPDSIADIPDDILNWAIECEATKRPFRIIKQELEFYRSQGIAIPHLHPDERHRRRMALRNPRKLWLRQCQKCGTDMQTTYSPDRLEMVYCESCYLESVY